MADVNPEFLAALPPNIQEEVLAHRRMEQQRQAAAAAKDCTRERGQLNEAIDGTLTMITNTSINNEEDFNGPSSEHERLPKDRKSQARLLFKVVQVLKRFDYSLWYHSRDVASTENHFHDLQHRFHDELFMSRTGRSCSSASRIIWKIDGNSLVSKSFLHRKCSSKARAESSDLTVLVNSCKMETMIPHDTN